MLQCHFSWQAQYVVTYECHFWCLRSIWWHWSHFCGMRSIRWHWSHTLGVRRSTKRFLKCFASQGCSVQWTFQSLSCHVVFCLVARGALSVSIPMSDHSPELCGHVLLADYHLGDLFVVDVKLAAKNPKAITGGVHMVALVLSPFPAGRNILKNNMHVKRSLEDWFVRAATRMWRCIRKDLYAFSSICSDAAWKTAAFLQNLGRGIEALLRWLSMYTWCELPVSTVIL